METDNDGCVKEITGTESVKVRLFMVCNVLKQAQKQLRVKLKLEGNHSLFWTQLHLPSVWVSIIFTSSLPLPLPSSSLTFFFIRH